MKTISRYLFVLGCLFFGLCQTTQAIPPQHMQDDLIGWQHYMKEADKVFEKGSYLSAIDFYQRVLSRAPKKTKAAYRIAIANYRLRDYEASNKWFAHVMELEEGKHPRAYYYRGMSLKYLGKYNKAIDQLQTFQMKAEEKQSDGSDDKQDQSDASLSTLLKRAAIEIKGCHLGLKWSEETIDKNVEAYHLREKINSPFSDYAPHTFHQDTLFYSSLPQEQAIPVDDTIQHRYSRIYWSTWSDSGWTKGKRIDAPFNKQEIHIGNPALTPNQDLLYFTQCEEQQDLSMRCSIYRVQKKDGSWGQAEKLSSPINPDTGHSTHPSIVSQDDSSNYLYFSSNRKGGKGGMDIWRARVDSSANVSEPENPGDSINTDFDEITPYFQPHQKRLYFSSNGHVGIGGYDVFRSDYRSDSTWSKPHNIGKPENSSVDDMYYRKLPDMNRAFLVSNRPSGFELKNETCCDDILSLRYLKHVFKGEVMTLQENKSVPVDNPVAKLKRYDPASGQYKVVEEDSVDGSTFSFEMDPSTKYKVEVDKSGYASQTETVNTTGKSVTDTMRSMVYVDKIERGKTYKLENVYFDLNKATLRPSSRKALDSLYLLLLDHPGIIIELSAHTDSRGNKEYNKNLSQKRAESCVSYLRKKGIPKERLKAKGYGESQLLNKCKDGVECSEEQHQKNRRTEFKVIGKIDGKIDYQDQRAAVEKSSSDTDQ
ncbi:MAG: hypothetical protein BRD50_04885 [Bacteroidetes bacterium SW_11_45_7]|nr:MAG: hypothetical protein BRD50_04885 [Bacteroidetes bacterium SW_11_45_7]